ncbi:MAG: NAD(P)H-binding protein [Chloroflexota bacterium]
MRTMQERLTLTAIGCTGPIGKIFVDGLLDTGIDLRVLARDPDRVAAQYPAAQVMPGSMLKADDVARAMQGADAALLSTPIGPRNETSIEEEAARAVIDAAKQVHLPHLIYISVIGIDRPTGIPVLDSKREVEAMLAAGGLCWTSIRCGSYMEDVIGTRAATLRRGIFLFPVTPERRFNFTYQGDVPRLVCELLRQGHGVNGALDCIDPQTYSVAEVAQLLSETRGHHVTPSGKWPLTY